METPTNFPGTVIKAFDTSAHLDDFHVGKFRLSRIEFFKTIEDKNRRDETEGTAEYVVRESITSVHFCPSSGDTRITEAVGDMHVSSNLGNPTYVFCTSLLPGQNEIAEKMGNFIVRIENPAAFARDIATYLKAQRYRLAGDVRGVIVQYSKSDLMPERLPPDENAVLSYSQKPERFKSENEFRFVVVLFDGPTDNLPEHIYVDMERRLDYVSRI